jgi:hypothetical protein
MTHETQMTEAVMFSGIHVGPKVEPTTLQPSSSWRSSSHSTRTPGSPGFGGGMPGPKVAVPVETNERWMRRDRNPQQGLACNSTRRIW